MKLPELIRFSKFALVGICTFGVDLLMLYTFIDVIGLHYVVAAVLAFVLASTLHYVFSRYYVFAGTTRSLRDGFVIFLCIEIVGVVAVAVLMYGLIEYAGYTPLISRLLVACVTGTWSYLMNVYVTFRITDRSCVDADRGTAQAINSG